MVAVVERSADTAAAARAIATARLAFQGRSVYAPDVILVNEFVANDFLRSLKQALAAPKGLLRRSTNTSEAQESTAASINKTLREFEKSKDASVLFAGDHGSIIEILDR